MTNLKHILSIGLAAATLAVVSTYVLAGQALLRSAYAEPAHQLFMSMYTPLIQAVTGHTSQAQMHGGPAPESQMGLIGNNLLGGPASMVAGGLAAVVVMGAIALAAAALVASWKQRSFVLTGLLAASGIILMIPPLSNINYVFPGPILGVVVGLAIFALGVAKGIRTARAVTVAPK